MVPDATAIRCAAVQKRGRSGILSTCDMCAMSCMRVKAGRLELLTGNVIDFAPPDFDKGPPARTVVEQISNARTASCKHRLHWPSCVQRKRPAGVDAMSSALPRNGCHCEFGEEEYGLFAIQPTRILGARFMEDAKLTKRTIRGSVHVIMEASWRLGAANRIPFSRVVRCLDQPRNCAERQPTHTDFHSA